MKMQTIRKFRRFGWAFALVVPLATQAADAAIAVRQDGLSIELLVNDEMAIVRWQHTELPVEPVEVSAEIIGMPGNRVIGNADRQDYPAEPERTALLSLVDISGVERFEGIDREIATLLHVVSEPPPHAILGFGVYGAQIRRIPASNVEALTFALTSLDPEVVVPDLAQTIRLGIVSLQEMPAQRRGLFIFTDGHSSGPIPVDELAEMARRQGIALTFLIQGTAAREADLPALEKLARLAGGQLVMEEELGAFLQDPFALLDSGATVAFPILRAKRYFWEDMPVLNVSLRHGEREINLSAPLENLPLAGARETLRHVWSAHPIATSSAGGGLALALLGVPFILGRRYFRRRHAGRPAIPAARALLIDKCTGHVFDLVAPNVQIGRDHSCDIVLEDPTVSRNHATVVRDKEKFIIKNEKGRNGVLVNGESVLEKTLVDRDMLSLGGVDLIFISV